MRIASFKHTARWLVGSVVLIILFVFGSAFISVRFTQHSSSDVRYGITFSTLYASSLGMNPVDAWRNLVDTFHLRQARIPVYWSEIEPEPGNFQWDELDALVAYAEERGVQLTLVIGEKVPRWPECYPPSWAIHEPSSLLNKHLLNMMTEVVHRYASSPALERWQIENEPLLPFGVCRAFTFEELQAQIAHVRSLDTHPIQLTASGEIGPWQPLAREADVLGISLYRITWNKLFGYFTYPIQSWMYRTRIAWNMWRTGTLIIVSELQAEPWFSDDIQSKEPSDWYDSFTAEDLLANVRYVESIGVSEVSLWGAEWWLYLHMHGDDRLWDAAKTLSF